MGKPSEASKTQDLELIDEWPIDLEGRMEGLMVEADEGKVLAALKLPSDYTDGCFVFDINNRTCQSENWFQPDWVKQHCRSIYQSWLRGLLGAWRRSGLHH
jgi:hypothetical protein